MKSLGQTELPGLCDLNDLTYVWVGLFVLHESGPLVNHESLARRAKLSGARMTTTWEL